MFGYQRFKISKALNINIRPAQANTAIEMMLFLPFLNCATTALLVLAGLAVFNLLSKDTGLGSELSSFCGVGWSTGGFSRVRSACVTNLVDLDIGCGEDLILSCCTSCWGGVIAPPHKSCWFGGVATSV